jgi:protease-4
MSETNDKTDYESIVQRLAFAAINEQRRSRRWRIFFLFLTFAYLTVVGIAFMGSGGGLGSSQLSDEGKHTALVQMPGIISMGEKSGAETVIAGLESAFEHEETVGVILEINSPGGSPVQAAYIYDEIIRLRQEHKSTPLYVVVSDIAASGGYFVAASADRIYVNKSSLIGSIGVRMDNFGFVELMNKLGIERRLLTAGDNKGLLDPFLPEDAGQKAHLQQMLNEVHQHFIDAVKQGRGERLSQQADLFSGLIWTGEKAIELGLVDEFGTTNSVARDVIKAETIVNFTPRGNLIDRIADSVGVVIGQQIESYFASKIR